LVNIFYRADEYTPLGLALYKTTVVAPSKGEKPTTSDVAASAAYIQAKNKSDQRWQSAVHSTDAARMLLNHLPLTIPEARTNPLSLLQTPAETDASGTVGADPKTASCTSLNTANSEYKGFAQPPQSPGYVDQAHMDRSIVKFGPIIKYLFDPTQPRMEERVKQGAARKVGAIIEA
jgi:hypothetical protein